MSFQTFIYLSVSLHLLLPATGSSINWLSKSLDNYGLKNCSFLDRSDIIGGFNTCLNKPEFKEENLNLTTTAATIEDENATTSNPIDSDLNQILWPASICKSTQEIIDCFPLITEHDCLTDNEVEFFNLTLEFFKAQNEFVCRVGDNLTEIMQNSSCSTSSIDAEQICFSMNTNKYRWLGWPLNYGDGQMCNYFIDLRDCEAKKYKDCPEEIYEFVKELWNVGMKVIPCELEKPVPTTLQPPKAWDKFINNEFNWNSGDMQNNQYNPMKKRKKPTEEAKNETSSDWNKFIPKKSE